MYSLFFWIGFFLVTVVFLVQRTADFIAEALYMDFHMTRVGLSIYGMEAAIAQMGIIFIASTISWKLRNIISMKYLSRK